MWLAKEAEKAGILAMRLGTENIPVQPVHLVPPGMRFANAVAAVPCGSQIDVGSWEFSPRHIVGCDIG